MKYKLSLILLLLLGTYIALARLSFREAELKPARVDMLLPTIPNLIVFFGDRYLAANIGYFRAVTQSVVEGSLVQERAFLQQQVMSYNPKHEDNYYLAASTFPWEGHINVAQNILTQAAQVRYWDSMPHFLLGLNAGNHQKNYIQAAHHIANAAEVEQGKNKAYFKALAATLYTRTDDLTFALAHVQMLAGGSTSKKIKTMMTKRANRIKVLIELRLLADQYVRQAGKPITQLNDLVLAGLVEHLPEDPLGRGYGVDQQGQPNFVERTRERN